MKGYGMMKEHGMSKSESKPKAAKSHGYSHSGGEKTANWPALPGPKQKRDRGMGIPKIKTSLMDDF
jgi:hypothetical protein